MGSVASRFCAKPQKITASLKAALMRAWKFLDAGNLWSDIDAYPRQSIKAKLDQIKIVEHS